MTSAAKQDLSLLATPEEEHPRETQELRLLKRLWPYLRPHLRLLVPAIVLMPVASLATLWQPYLQKVAVDAAIVDRSSEALSRVAILYALTIGGEFLARFAQSYTMQLAGQRAMSDLRIATFRHVHTLGLRYFDRTPVGRIVTRVTNDIDALVELFGSGAVTAIADIFMLVGIVIFMLYLDWRLTLVALAALPPLAIVVNAFRKYAREAFRQIRARIAQLNAFVAEQVQGITVVQAFGREERCAKEFRAINARHRNAHYQSIRYDALLYSVVESVATASIAILLWYAAVRTGTIHDSTASRMYVGVVVAFYQYIQQFFTPIRDLSTKYTIVQSSLTAAERIFALHDVAESDAPNLPPEAVSTTASDAALEIRGLTFAYRPGHPVLHGIDLNVGRGETVALVGATGAGKTTILSLLLRLYELEEGSISILGKEIRSYPRKQLRELFAVVPQDVFLFAGTVRDNVAVGDSTPDDARVTDALRRVGALELLERRGEGIHAPVGERGNNFSAGERQLIALGRALYRNPPLLVLDEATANVDSETEARLRDAVAEVVRGRAALIVAHRLSTIRHADRIVVMHKGHIAEEGSHDALIAQRGIYARLHALQFTDPPATPPAAVDPL